MTSRLRGQDCSVLPCHIGNSVQKPLKKAVYIVHSTAFRSNLAPAVMTKWSDKPSPLLPTTVHSPGAHCLVTHLKRDQQHVSQAYPSNPTSTGGSIEACRRRAGVGNILILEAKGTRWVLSGVAGPGALSGRHCINTFRPEGNPSNGLYPRSSPARRIDRRGLG